jgi:hypothetical protein
MICKYSTKFCLVQPAAVEVEDSETKKRVFRRARDIIWAWKGSFRGGSGCDSPRQRSILAGEKGESRAQKRRRRLSVRPFGICRFRLTRGGLIMNVRACHLWCRSDQFFLLHWCMLLRHRLLGKVKVFVKLGDAEKYLQLFRCGVRNHWTAFVKVTVTS